MVGTHDLFIWADINHDNRCELVLKYRYFFILFHKVLGPVTLCDMGVTLCDRGVTPFNKDM